MPSNLKYHHHTTLCSQFRHHSTSQTRPTPQPENRKHWHSQRIWRLPFFSYYNNYMTSMQATGADITGMAEPNTVWQHHHLRSSFTSQARKHFGATNISFLAIRMRKQIQFQKRKPFNLVDLLPWQKGALYQSHTGGAYHGSNRFGMLELTHSMRKVKCIPLHHYCIQSLLRINWDFVHWQHIQL